MQCRNHPDRKADHFCATCNIPLCSDCGEETSPGVYTCFQCGMLQSVSQVGTSLAERQRRAAKRQTGKGWGPFHYFLAVSCVLIGVMWGVILFGGTEAPQQATLSMDKDRAGRVFLFLVNGAIKRYAHHEKRGYPAQLSDLVPKYLQIRKESLPALKKLLYEVDPGPDKGYRLSLVRSKPGEMKVILTPKGIIYSQPSEGQS